MLPFVSVLLIIFLVAAVYAATQETRESNTVVPFNSRYTPLTSKTQEKKKDATDDMKMPTIDPATGNCCVCGHSRGDGHGWPCIVYLMKLAVDSYDKKFVMMEKFLDKLLTDAHVYSKDVEDMKLEIKAARDLISGVGSE